jgi:hypothetical protein
MRGLYGDSKERAVKNVEDFGALLNIQEKIRKQSLDKFNRT